MPTSDAMTEGPRAAEVGTSAVIPERYNFLYTRLRSRVLNGLAYLVDAPAAAFYRDLVARGYLPNVLIDVLPEHRLIYVSVPKAASTTIRMVLSVMIGRAPAATTDDQHIRRISGLLSPRHAGISAFYRLARDPRTLRFSFVRNPYDRLVSAWADKFRNRPLVPGDPYVEEYLLCRPRIDSSLPRGPDRVLSLADFVTYATATADRRVNIHWQLQDDILSMPGLPLDFVGKVERFTTDFVRVLDHLQAPAEVRRLASARHNVSHRSTSRDYLTPDLADRIYRAYERDFDRFGYPRALPT